MWNPIKFYSFIQEKVFEHLNDALHQVCTYESLKLLKPATLTFSHTVCMDILFANIKLVVKNVWKENENGKANSLFYKCCSPL